MMIRVYGIPYPGNLVLQILKCPLTVQPILIICKSETYCNLFSFTVDTQMIFNGASKVNSISLFSQVLTRKYHCTLL